MNRALSIPMAVVVACLVSWPAVAGPTPSRDQLQRERQALLRRLSELDRKLGASPSVPSPRPRDSGGRDAATVASLVVIASLAGVIVVVGVYLLVVAPRRKRRPFLKAVRIIEADETGEFERAEELLREAIAAGMRRRDVADASFALAYVRARMGRYEEAAATLPDLKRLGGAGPADIYLGLWIHARLEHHDEVERAYAAHGEELADFLDAKLIAAVSYLAKARQHWRQRRIQAARRYYESVRALGVLVEQIPEGIDEHQALLGVEALFDGDVDDARRQFEEALETVREGDKPGLSAQLGLVLCDWVDGKRGSSAEALGKILDDMVIEAATEGALMETACAHCATRFTVKKRYESRRVACLECRRCFIVTEVEGDGSTDATDREGEAGAADARYCQLLTDDDLLARNVLLWRMVAYMHTWLDLPRGAKLGAARLGELKEHADAVTRVSSDMPDPVLLYSLIDYYFADSDERRNEAVERLRQADVTVPEVISLLDRHEKAEAERRNVVERYFEMLEGYFGDPTVSLEARQAVRERLERFERFRGRFDEIETGKAPNELDRSISGLGSRAGLIKRRITVMVKPTLTEADEAHERLERLIQRLEEDTRRLSDDAKSVEKTETQLIVRAGEHLLHDEEPVDEGPDDEQSGGAEANE